MSQIVSRAHSRTRTLPETEGWGRRLWTAFTAISLALALAIAMAAAPAFAKNDKAKGKGKQGGKPAVEQGDTGTLEQAGDRLEAEVIDEVLDGIFGENERTIIERYYRDNPPDTQSLPPGIAKNLAAGKPLPPGIAKKQLPGALERQLPPLSSEYERILVGDDVTIVQKGTEIIVDVLKDVLSR